MRPWPVESTVCSSELSGESGRDCDTSVETLLGERLSKERILEMAGLTSLRGETEQD